jgi:hypothetical protein
MAFITLPWGQKSRFRADNKGNMNKAMFYSISIENKSFVTDEIRQFTIVLTVNRDLLSIFGMQEYLYYVLWLGWYLTHLCSKISVIS